MRGNIRTRAAQALKAKQATLHDARHRLGFSWGRRVRLSVIMYMTVPTATSEVAMKFLQDRRVLWGGAVIIVLIVLAVMYGWPGVWPGGETPPAQ